MTLMSALTRKLDEVRRLQETYSIYKDSEDDRVRRKVHLDVDRFLMENREVALLCFERVLAEELDELKKLSELNETKLPWYKRLYNYIRRLHHEPCQKYADKANTTGAGRTS